MTQTETKLLKVGDRVRFRDGSKTTWCGTIVEVTPVAVTVRWDDGVLADFFVDHNNNNLHRIHKS